MHGRFGKRGLVLTVCYPLSLAWLAYVMLTATLILFRAVKTSGIAAAIQFNDIPLLRYFDTTYPQYYWGMAGAGVVVILLFLTACWRCFSLGNPFSVGRFRQLSREQKSAVLFVLALLTFAATTAIACLPLSSDLSTTAVQPISWLDWTGVAAMATCGWLMPHIIMQLSQASRPVVKWQRPQPVESSFTVRTGMLYILGCGALMGYALLDHQKFWDPVRNGGYDYQRFFRDDEIPDAKRVLVSTSFLFASLTAIGGCMVVGLFRKMVRRDATTAPAAGGDSPLGDGRNVSILSAATWAGILLVPWQLKLWPEIEGERGWIFPATTFVCVTASLIPLIHVGWLMMTSDFEERASRRLARRPSSTPLSPRGSEVAFWNFVLFLVYPWIRWLRIGGPAILFALITIAVGATIAGMSWFANEAENLYQFEDWRGMLRTGQFPLLRVSFALMCACFAYVVLRRMLLVTARVFRRIAGSELARSNGFPRFQIVGRIAVATLVLASLGLASWPFWGWKGIRENVFTRTWEFSSRHDFELTLLHWLFDFDRDGYASVLHGADPDDFDADVQPGHIDPPRDDNAVPFDTFAVADVTKARDLPNVMILFLEGVTPKSISAYGQRQVQGTPNIDSVARDGTVFLQARCFYPSTWDGWFSTVSGRFLRIKEMDMSRPFGDRYSRYNNLYKVLQLAGVNRWCHMNCPPFYKSLVHEEYGKSEKTAWMPEYNSDISSEDEKRDIWRGDKRNQRILQFLGDLQEGEKFFVCEHMADTHFPWREVKEFEWASADAVLYNGGRNTTYSQYFQNIARMDGQVGQLLSKLKEKGLYDNTIIIIVSDHGCQWWEHERMYYVSHLYDQSLRVPMIVKVPGIPGGKRVEDPVLQVDLVPTIMELAGVFQENPREDYPMPGHSLVPLMKGTATAAQKDAYRQRDMPLTTHYDKLGVLSNFRYKLIFNRPAGTYKLFDLKEDPMEKDNLVDDEPELKEEMMRKLRFLIHQNPAIIGGIKPSEGSP